MTIHICLLCQADTFENMSHPPTFKNDRDFKDHLARVHKTYWNGQNPQYVYYYEGEKCYLRNWHE